MSLAERWRDRYRPINSDLDAAERAELNAAIDAIACQRLYHARREIQAAIADVREGMGAQQTVDRLLDAWNRLREVGT